jgi:hypothetical protein
VKSTVVVHLPCPTTGRALTPSECSTLRRLQQVARDLDNTRPTQDDVRVKMRVYGLNPDETVSDELVYAALTIIVP